MSARLVRRLRYYLSCASEISKFNRLGANADKSVVWYFTSESREVRRFIASVFGEHKNTSWPNFTDWTAYTPRGRFSLVLDPDTVYHHGDCRTFIPHWFKLSESQKRELCPQSDQNHSVVHAAGQLYAMAQADWHVFSYSSGFGRYGAVFSATDRYYWLEGPPLSQKDYMFCTPENSVPHAYLYTRRSGV